MFLELIDILRCTAPHEEIPLVAAILTRNDRDVLTGILGCPTCGAEYPVENGIAIFGDSSPPRATPPGPYAEPDDELAVRCAAMLNLFDPGGTAVLAGSWARSAAALHEMTGVSLLLIGPPPEVRLGGGIAGIRIGASLPLPRGSVRGVALDDGSTPAVLIESAARALKAGGRLIAPTGVTVPAGIIERARDDRHWVGEAEPGVSAPVQLTKGRTRQANEPM